MKKQIKTTRKVKCENCDYEWMTTSQMIYVTCPKCLVKTKINGGRK